MWQALQISILGALSVMFSIFVLFCTVLVTKYVTDKILERGSSDG